MRIARLCLFLPRVTLRLLTVDVRHPYGVRERGLRCAIIFTIHYYVFTLYELFSFYSSAISSIIPIQLRIAHCALQIKFRIPNSELKHNFAFNSELSGNSASVKSVIQSAVSAFYGVNLHQTARRFH